MKKYGFLVIRVVILKGEGAPATKKMDNDLVSPRVSTLLIRVVEKTRVFFNNDVIRVVEKTRVFFNNDVIRVVEKTRVFFNNDVIIRVVAPSPFQALGLHLVFIFRYSMGT